MYNSTSKLTFFSQALLIQFFIIFLTSCSDTPQDSWSSADNGIYDAALSSNGQYALVASVDNSAKLWDLPSHTLLHTLEHGDNSANIIFTAISASNQTALTANSTSFAIWDIASGARQSLWSVPEGISAVALSSKGRYVLLGLSTHHAKLINTQSGQILKVFQHADRVTQVALSQDNQYALSGSRDKQVKLWHIPTSKQMYSWPHLTSINQVAISPKNNIALTSAGQFEVYLWDMHTGEQLRQLTIHGGLAHRLKPAPMSIGAALFSADEKQLLTGSPPRLLRLWDVQSGDLLNTWALPNQSFWQPTGSMIYALALTQRESIIITQSSDGMGYAWAMPD